MIAFERAPVIVFVPQYFAGDLLRIRGAIGRAFAAGDEVFAVNANRNIFVHGCGFGFLFFSAVVGNGG